MKMKRLTAMCLALAVLCAGLGVWAVTGQVRVSKLSTQVRALEAAQQETGAARVSLENPDAIAAEFDGGVVTTNTPRRFFSENSFYTTAANRMSRHMFKNAITNEDVIKLWQMNKG